MVRCAWKPQSPAELSVVAGAKIEYCDPDFILLLFAVPSGSDSDVLGKPLLLSGIPRPTPFCSELSLLLLAYLICFYVFVS